MESRRAKQLEVLQHLINNLYDPLTAKQRREFDDTGINRNYDTYSKLLQTLPPTLKPFFHDMTSDCSAYKTVWLGVYLKSIYQGVMPTISTPESWEDEVDFYQSCVEMFRR